MAARIGTISHGTLRTEDLLGAFLNELNKYSIGGCQDDAAAWLDHYSNDDDADHNPEFMERGVELVSQLEDALQDYAPPYCYFGTLEGDGSDFGFWPSLDAIQEAIDNSTLNDDGEYINEEDGVRIVVSDHGNVEIYSLATNESLLAIV